MASATAKSNEGDLDFREPDADVTKWGQSELLIFFNLTLLWGCSVPVPSSAQRYEQSSLPLQNTLRGHFTSPRLAASPSQQP